MKNKISIIHREEKSPYPAGKTIFYLCTECRKIIETFPEPEPGTACCCSNIRFDIGRVSIKSDDSLIILKIE